MDVLVEPLGGMRLVALQRAVVRIDAGELHVLAEVVPAFQTEETVAARNAGLDCDPVAGDKVGDAFSYTDDDAGGLVAENAVAFDHQGADAAGFPEVNIGAASSGKCPEMEEKSGELWGLKLTHTRPLP